MRFAVGKTPTSRAQAQRNVGAYKSLGKGIQNYGRNVVGGAKIVGGAVKKKVKSGEDMLKKAMKKLGGR